ncbi:MAG: phosphoribosylaminoimidazolesuccinocarboxamide synthase [Acholeplasmatales bacterium]|nr:phosphoribosylaminoimidazolesuccinocarboxamide synthase [Acholeplasmatales bacterium]
MEKKELLYEGKAKQVYATDDKDVIIIHYKDDATAFNGVKHAQIAEKGELNNKITTIIFKKLQAAGIPTHYIETLNDRDQLCKLVKIVPLEVIVRNIIAGSMSKRLGIPEGTKPSNTIFEICYKDDALGDPLINDHHAVAVGACSYEDLATIYDLTAKINKELQKIFLEIGVVLVDFKIEFGKTSDGQIVLADEISPDCCRLWDAETNDKLDKDRFRRDLGNVIDAYKTIYSRLQKLDK